MTASLIEKLARLPAVDRASVLGQLNDEQVLALIWDWPTWRRPDQCAPEGDWLVWLVMAGRGYGKTRMGCEWIRSQTEGPSPLIAHNKSASRIALVGETWQDVREVMVEGESGLLARTPAEWRPTFEPSRRRLVWPNGAIANLFAAAEPDQLRGPQFHLAWADEIAKWPNGERAWSNLMFGLRLGDRPRVVATTTPRPLPWLIALAKDDKTHVTRGRTRDNRAHLAPAFLHEVERLYGGTRLGRQELDGEIIDDVDGALWSRDMVEACRVSAVPELSRIVVGIDPPVSAGPDADACGIIVAGAAASGQIYVLEDASAQGLSPHQWGTRAIQVFHRHRADRLVAEVNQGGDLVRTLVHQIDPGLSFRAVRASRGKMARAEPVAALYERGLVHHVGAHAALEEELCTFAGLAGQASPDRMDALVWAISDLALRTRAQPRLARL